MKTKIFTLLLAVAAGVGTMLAEKVQIGNLYYNLDATNKTAEVTYQNSGYPFWSTSITTANIPSSVEYNSVTYSVTSIGDNAFSYCSGLTSVTIPNSVTSIGWFAFENCSGLTSVTIPNSVTSIGEYAFHYCSGLTKVNITDIAAWCAISFGDGANPLCYAHNLYLNGELVTNLVIPEGVTSIGSSAFQGCSGLTSVTIPNSVTSIGGGAFKECSRLTSVTIPNSVTNIGSNAFNGCSKLTSVTLPNSVTSIGNYAFYYCTGLTSVTIPNSVTSIGESAFNGCRGLKSVTIPNSVTSIGGGAFKECSRLTSVTIPNSVTSIGEYAFHYCSGLTKVNITDIAAWCAISFGDGANPLCYAHNLYLNGELVTNLVIPEGVTSIGSSAFQSCSGLTSVTIPNSVTSIGASAFSDCSGLTSINVASDNSYYCSVDGVLFNKNQTELIQYPVGNTRPEYIIPNSVTSIGYEAFFGCSSLTSVTIPNSVTSIGNMAFFRCSGLTSVTIPNSVTSIGNAAFYRCTSLTSIDIPNSVTSIEGFAFYDCKSLTSVTIGNGVTSIGECAFENCTGLTSVTIPNSVTSIGDYAFNGCSSLTSVTIGNSVTSIGGSAFYGCTGLLSIEIPNGVTSIGESAFNNCSGLTSIEIPNSVTSIGYRAFYWCKSLSSIYNYATSPQVIDNSVFNGEEVEYEGIQYYGPVDKSICKLYVPAGSIDLYKAAEGWKDFTNIQAIVCSVSLVCDSVRGSIEGDSGEFDYLSQLTYTAVPNEGYYFIQWSDGVTDNPRTIELTQDTILTALFDSIPTGQDTTATEIKNDSVTVSATPTEDNSVILEWPAVEGADTYTIAIYKNDELICTLVFDAEGHLISIRFAAPARDGNGRNIPVAEQAANGWRYVVNGLEGNATYTYSVVAKDENGNVLLSESIDFTMPVLLSVDNIDSSSLQGGDRGRLILRNGTIFILHGEKVYTVTGQEVK